MDKHVPTPLVKTNNANDYVADITRHAGAWIGREGEMGVEKAITAVQSHPIIAINMNMLSSTEDTTKSMRTPMERFLEREKVSPIPFIAKSFRQT